MIKPDNSFESVMKRLSLEQLDTYLFRFEGMNAGIQRIYGGQVIAQAYIAADATIEEDKHIHSLHAYFLRPGIKKQPVLFSVDQLEMVEVFQRGRLKQYKIMRLSLL